MVFRLVLTLFISIITISRYCYGVNFFQGCLSTGSISCDGNVTVDSIINMTQLEFSEPCIIKNCSKFHIYGSVLSLKNLVFQGPLGGFSVESGQVSLENCTFSGLKDEVTVSKNASLKMINVKFEKILIGPAVTSHGASLDCSGCVFQDIASHAIVFPSGGSLNIKDSIFMKGGGSFVQSKRTNISISNSSFESGQASCLSLDQGSSALVSQSYFKNCHSKEEGGAVKLVSLSNLILKDSIFDDNRCEYQGGAIYVDGKSKVIGENVRFLGNSAGKLGGAIYLGKFSQFWLLNNNEFRQNFATSGGGALALGRESIFRILSGDTLLVQNSAEDGDGGSIWSAGGEIDISTVCNVTFHGNSAGREGGAIFLDLGSKLTMKALKSRAFENIANHDGGWLLARGNSKLIITPHTFEIGKNDAREGSFICLASKLVELQEPKKFTNSIQVTSAAMQEIYVADLDFGEGVFRELASNLPKIKTFGPASRLFIDHNSKLETRVKLNFSDTTKLPAIPVKILDAFGNVVRVPLSSPIILTVSLVNSSSLLYGDIVKIFVNDKVMNSSYVNFSNLRLANIMPKTEYVISFTTKTLQDGRDAAVTLYYDPCQDGYILEGGRCFQVKNISISLLQAFGVLGFLGIIYIVAVLYVLYAFRRTRQIRLNSFPFLTFMCVGNLSAFLGISTSITGISCVTLDWLMNIGFFMVFLTIACKTFRIMAIFSASKNVKKGPTKIMTENLLLSWFLVYMIGLVVFLIIWTVTEPSVKSRRLVSTMDSAYFAGDVCVKSKFSSIVTVIKIFVLVVIAFLTFSIRNVPSEYNESKFILISTYIWVIFDGILGQANENLITDVNSKFIISCISVMIPHLVSNFLLVLLKVRESALDPSNSDSLKMLRFSITLRGNGNK